MTDEIRCRLKEMVCEHPGIALSKFFHSERFATKDDIFTLIAEEAICANLNTGLLAEPDSAHLFTDWASVSEFERLQSAAPDVSARIELRLGNSFRGAYVNFIELWKYFLANLRVKGMLK